ncbi:MAG: CarD family transcriptional regulator [Acidobacteria bacterium]|nr:CarD family transcriptional regulator [Acidobacteriota bacterium]
MAFKVGEKVVYPNHGVGVIESISQKVIGGSPEEFYTLRIESNSSVVLIPTANVNQVGLRKLCARKDLDQLFEILQGGNGHHISDWKDRYKVNLEKMKSGSIFEVAEVLKNLTHLSAQKSLSFREKKMLDRARQLVISEVATVKKWPLGRIEGMIDECLGCTTRVGET